MKLTQKQNKTVLGIIDDLFWTLKANWLGRFFKGPKIYFEIVDETNPMETLEGIYTYTKFMINGPNYKVNKQELKQISDITNNYIEAERLKTKNKIIESINRSDNIEEIQKELAKQMDKTSNYINLLVGSETRGIQSKAESAGIVEVASSLGIEDPVICKRGVIDNRLSDQCKGLWHTNANIAVPTVYKLSELSGGYNTDMKNPKPTTGLTHVNCRHVMSFVPPNFGFDQNGNLVFKGFGHDEYENQKGNK